jgi:hypothetical protein
MRRGTWSFSAFALLAMTAAMGPALGGGYAAPPTAATVARSPHTQHHATDPQGWWAWARYCVARARRRRYR